MKIVEKGTVPPQDTESPAIELEEAEEEIINLPMMEEGEPDIVEDPSPTQYIGCFWRVRSTGGRIRQDIRGGCRGG